MQESDAIANGGIAVLYSLRYVTAPGNTHRWALRLTLASSGGWVRFAMEGVVRSESMSTVAQTDVA